MQLTIILKYYGDAKKRLMRGASYVCLSLFTRVARIFSKRERDWKLEIPNRISLRYQMTILRKTIVKPAAKCVKQELGGRGGRYLSLLWRLPKK